MAKEIAFTDTAPRPIGPYSQGVVVGGFLFASGQVGTDPETGEFASSLTAEQTRKALENLTQVLQSKGYSLKDVVKTTVYLINMGDFPELNKVYGEFFASDPPARTTVAVSSLPKGALMEIEAIAFRET